MSGNIFKCTIDGFDITGAFEAVDWLFEREYLSVSCSEKNDRWTVEILDYKLPAESEILSALGRDKKTISMKIEELKQEDWLKKCFENFKPIVVGDFYIYGPHLRGSRIPSNKIPIEVAAATAFGSGEHPTTACCLNAIQAFFDDRKHRRVLDIGCGSGILSIAFAKLGARDVTACDHDPESVKISYENFQINKVAHRVSVFQNKDTEFSNKKYDFIVANILAEPLISMSSDIVKSLGDDGILVLSGFVSEDKSVFKKYLSLGLIKRFSYDSAGWSTIVFSRDSGCSYAKTHY